MISYVLHWDTEKIEDFRYTRRDDTLKDFNVNNLERQQFIIIIRNSNEHASNRSDYLSDKYLNTRVELIKE